MTRTEVELQSQVTVTMLKTQLLSQSGRWMSNAQFLLPSRRKAAFQAARGVQELQTAKDRKVWGTVNKISSKYGLCVSTQNRGRLRQLSFPLTTSL